MSKEKSFLSKLFGQARGSKMAGAQFMADNNITSQDVDNLTRGQIEVAFEQYKRAHGANGIEYTNDIAIFEEFLRMNLYVASDISKSLRRS